MPNPITLSIEQIEEAEMTLRALAHFYRGSSAELYILIADMLKIEQLEMFFQAKVTSSPVYKMS